MNYDISGAGDQIEIGADGLPAGVSAGNGYSRKRKLWAPFTSAALGAGATGPVTVRCLVPFRVTKVVFSAATAANYTLSDPKVGNQPQTAANGNAPGDCLMPTNDPGINVEWDTCQAGEDITFNVTATAAGTATGILIGDCLQK